MVSACFYISLDDGNVHQYVKTYGARNKRNDSLPVYFSLNGVWGSEDKNTDGWYFRTDEEGVHLKKGYKRMFYEYSDCIQYGDQAMLLCENGLPQWTIVLNKDCVIDKSTDLICQGTISLCKVSMEETDLQILAGPPLKLDLIPTWWEMTEERGTLLKEQMQEIIQKDPELVEFESYIETGLFLDGEGYKIITDSTDIFQIGMLVNQAELMQKQKTESNREIQITSIELLAGDVLDFFISVEIEDMKDPENAERAAYQYRIMKGNGVYLAVAVDDQTDGSIGLEPLEAVQKIDTGNNPKFHYVI